MDNRKLLIQRNKPTKRKKLRYVNDATIIQIRAQYFDLSCLKQIIWTVNEIARINYKMQKKLLIIQFGSISVIDRLTWVLLECICYTALVDYNVLIHIEGHILNDNMLYKMDNSSLVYLNRFDESNFKHKFMFSIKSDYYRILITKDYSETNKLSIKFGDISSFLTNMGLPELFSIDLADTIVELMGNQCEHGMSDCLVDINVCRNYLGNNGESISVVSVALVGLSPNNFGDALKEKILSLQDEQDMRYNTVKEAYNYHKQHFTEYYTEADFFCAAAYQDQISSRSERTWSGGKGLTKLIQSLEHYSDQYMCYMVYGDRCILFDEKYLDSNMDDWIGFNDSRNFVNDIPDKSVFTSSPIYIPGVAYNLVFVVK